MEKYFCDKCQRELIQGNNDLITGELRVKFPAEDRRSNSLLLVQSMSMNQMQPTERDLCNKCLIVALSKR